MLRVGLVLALLLPAAPGHAATPEDLVRAYPQALEGFDGANIVWRDGTRMPLGRVTPGGEAAALPDATIADQLAADYPAGAPLLPPPGDPGRARNQAFFNKMYGDCRAGEVAPRLVQVAWLGRSVVATSVNGVDQALAAVARELEALPDADRAFLAPIGGTFKCRAVAGTDQRSMHAWGAAIDINTARSDYWRWSRGGGDAPPWRNRIPADIVAAFERHGFIWGGRWAHYDTMHFEYRPELLGGAPAPG